MDKEETGSSFGEETNFKVTSGAIKEHCSFEWKIENYLAIKSSKNFIEEQKFQFSTGSCKNTCTKRGCFLQESVTKNMGIFVVLTQSPSTINYAVAGLEFEVIKSNVAVLKSGRVEAKQFTLNSLAYGCHEFIPGDEQKLKKLLSDDGSIVIRVTFGVFLLKPVKVVQPSKVVIQEELKMFEKSELQKLSDFLTHSIKMDDQPEFEKRIKIVSNDNLKFYTNTALLSARSPVFQEMFTSKSWKKGEGSSSGEATLVLNDLSGKTVKVLLHYLVGGVLLKEDWDAEDVVLELTWAAQKYQLDDLTKFLDKVLPEIDYTSTEVVAKLALLTCRLGMKNSEEKLFLMLKETATNIDELVLDKTRSLVENVTSSIRDLAF